MFGKLKLLSKEFVLRYLNTLRRDHPTITIEVPEDSTRIQTAPTSSSSAFEILREELLLLEASSSRPSSSCNYDVFLSFRGEDTRYGFTDHLYSALCRTGIDTFRDTEELPRGDSIAPELRKAIEESKFAVIILSPNYADSKWCLDELAYVLSCKKTRGLRVFPVFYHVEPSEIRKQTGKFGRAFVNHKKAFKDNTCKVDNWRQDLKEVADVSGWNAKDR
ncbi:PREDICTED: toll/interleukin-1 receptor-like protein [Fragaria vesca subsp. vesca]|uniref:toll/interleukin-1 receptor-like protein n=1 Tax=Fragaria vesca subsp. vesca TaxID=101020 RepID=UPI0002C322E6|nr:PREDICTED: toll/interleukin-1 receptor-like protein [Fragaria vesca subsp. vesca]